MHIIARVVRVVHDTLTFGDLVVFIVTGKNYNGRMVAEFSDRILGFCLDVFVDLFVGWVESTTEHKVLPDQNASFIASTAVSYEQISTHL